MEGDALYLRQCLSMIVVLQLMRSLEFMATKVRKGELAKDWVDDLDEGIQNIFVLL
jgi:hypothetical protein